ncbi:chromo' (CHRromatin Organization MOdifier) domain containing protein [Acanthamoeba castellanii str. Neff]|uniref:Chromo' (CHRromatin Organization MOdifier) domain containing protein n=1 Tax=Acanthamoeba castellanii (strain ATCC 30010 / Neff) TaxID=1257118 RepID=L8GEM4_ACACF|nr:chromo' (CHRromatin Organization MOdifier) domain containing protein [Acanthamoeba castellanii str. Neff]ELR11163.1 chromo' (CHRromatin Organization MOdifier) domain containing protein [Acanthamoeba castellanii str. Neff]
MSSARKKASKKAAESDSEGRPSRTKRAPSRLDPSSDAGELSGGETPRRGGSRRRSVSVERKKRRGPGRPRKTESARSKSPAKKRVTAHKRRRSVDLEREYEVEQFLDLQLLVKWKGYAKSSATWEPLKNLQTCDEMVVDYLEKVKQKLLAQMESKSSEEETKEGEGEKEKEGEGVETPKRKRGRPPKKAKVTEKASEEEVGDEKEADE